MRTPETVSMNQEPVVYPLFVFERDDCSMLLIDEREQIQQYLEAIDVENGEYVFWDATAKGVAVSVTARGVWSRKVWSVTHCEVPMTLEQAFLNYATTRGISEELDELRGNPIDVWSRIQQAIQRLPRRRSLVSRLFSR